MEVDRYLERLGQRPPRVRSADLETLAALMHAHLLTIPLENLDLHLGVPIRLDPARFYRKIVLSGRGGGCYELNGLFAELLRALGYRVDLLSGRVIRPGRVGPEFDHLALRVTLGDRQFLVDVGFGDGIRRPMELSPGATETFGSRELRMVDRDGVLALEALSDGELDKGYLLSEVPRQLSDFESVRRQHHEDPRSWFVRTRLVTLATPSGRRTLMNDRYKITEGDQVTDTTVERWQYLRVLRDDFAIELGRLPETKAEWPSMRIRAAAYLWGHRARKLFGFGSGD